ncbi:MAG: hypothetical protein ACR2QE_13950 [Acidimicrobiales bacterium]
MLDHVFTDAISVLRDALEGVLLERQTLEERFQVDILLGDCTWQTSYGLPGEDVPARLRADITLEWPTWAQTAYRTWTIGEPGDEFPAVELTVVYRVQQLSEAPDLEQVLGAAPAAGPVIGAEPLIRASPTVEIGYHDDLSSPHYATEITFEGRYEFDEASLADGASMDAAFRELGSWMSSTLVRLGDLSLPYLPRG